MASLHFKGLSQTTLTFLNIWLVMKHCQMTILIYKCQLINSKLMMNVKKFDSFNLIQLRIIILIYYQQGSNIDGSWTTEGLEDQYCVTGMKDNEKDRLLL